jgi:hypothetical protein
MEQRLMDAGIMRHWMRRTMMRMWRDGLECVVDSGWFRDFLRTSES